MAKILIVEDEKILGEMYRDKFTQARFDVVWVESAEAGIRIIKKEKFDLVLLDILLPKANGIQFLKKLKVIPEVAGVPVVAFSNYDDPETKREAAKLGVKDYLIKTSYTPQEIIEKVKEYLK
jgi:DNA-binding response OmpR family regulator